MTASVVFVSSQIIQVSHKLRQFNLSCPEKAQAKTVDLSYSQTELYTIVVRLVAPSPTALNMVHHYPPNTATTSTNVLTQLLISRICKF